MMFIFMIISSHQQTDDDCLLVRDLEYHTVLMLQHDANNLNTAFEN